MVNQKITTIHLQNILSALLALLVSSTDSTFNLSRRVFFFVAT